MAETAKTANANPTDKKPGQWKLVAVLAAVFVCLLASGGGEEEEESDDVGESLTELVVSPESSAAAARRAIKWPDIPLEFLLVNNPFQPGAARSMSLATDPVAVAEADSSTQSSETSNGEQGDKSDEGVEDAFGGSVETVAGPFAKNASQIAGKKVKMIFRSARGAAAVIDDRIYREGDKINEFIITSINQDGVTLTPAESRAELPPFSKTGQ